MGIGSFLSKRVLQPFAKKPGLGLPKGATRLITVEEAAAGKKVVQEYVQKMGKDALSVKSGAKLNMMPIVNGGFREGDIVLRGNSLFTTAQSGMVTTLSEGITKGNWKRHQATVSHAGIVARNAKGELRVVHMVTSQPADDIAHMLTPRQKKLKATFLREDSLHDFFNVKGTPITRAAVMRPKDPKAAYEAARRAETYFRTQVTAEGTRPWYSKLPNDWAPDGRGGVCSTFVDLAFGEKFKPPYLLPTTPEHFLISPLTEKVGDKTITNVRAVGQALGEGVAIATRR